MPKDLSNRPEQDLDVEEKGAVRDVVDVEIDPPSDQVDSRRFPAQAMNLRQAGDAWHGMSSQPVIADQLVEFPIMRECMRPGADERHFTLDHIEKLREFVKARAPEPAPDPGDPRVVALCLNYSRTILKNSHCPEFVNPERATVEASPGLTKQDGAWRVQADRHRDQDEERNAKHKGQ